MNIVCRHVHCDSESIVTLLVRDNRLYYRDTETDNIFDKPVFNEKNCRVCAFVKNLKSSLNQKILLKYREQAFFDDWLDMNILKTCSHDDARPHVKLCCPKAVCRNCNKVGHVDLLCKEG